VFAVDYFFVVARKYLSFLLS